MSSAAGNGDAEKSPVQSYFTHARKASEEGRKPQSMQDRLLEKVLSSMIPDLPTFDNELDKERITDGRAQLSVGILTWNFRLFSARIGVMFSFQWRVIRLLSWRKPTETLSALSIFSFICLYPYLLAVLPIAVMMIGVMIPAYIVRHPPSPSSHTEFMSPARGPPLAPAVEPKPVPELSRDFFMNMRDIQNLMEDYSNSYDRVVSAIAPPTNFGSEPLSATVFLFFFILCILGVGFGSWVPWRYITLILGWVVICSKHPAVQQYIHTQMKSERRSAMEKKAFDRLDNWIEADIIDDEAPQREWVEVFEIQKRRAIASPRKAPEWQDWLYSTGTYEPHSPMRLSHQKPVGTRFRDDVMPPVGWRFLETFRWRIDEEANWVEERQLIEVSKDRNGWVADQDTQPPSASRWRRRRWTRLAERIR